MERKELVSLVAAILATRAGSGNFDTTVKEAEELVKMVESGKHVPKSDWSGRG